MASTNEQIKRIETDILKVQTKIKAYQEKLSQLTEIANSCRNALCLKRSVRLHQPMTMRRRCLTC